MAKLEEKEKEKHKEKEEKAKAKGKKIGDGNVVVPTSSTADQSSHLVEGSRSGMKRKAVLPEWTEDMVTQGTQVSTLDDDDVKSEELILNVSIVDIMDNLDRSPPNSYIEVMDFIRKVCRTLKFNVFQECSSITGICFILNFPGFHNHYIAGKYRKTSIIGRQGEQGPFGGSHYF